MAAKRKPAKKTQGWEDSIPFVNMLRKPTAPKSVKSSVKATNKAGRAANAIARESAIAAFGDPKKGWKDVAVNTGTWFIPYGKGFEAVDKVIKGGKVIKSTRSAVRGAKGVKKVTKGTKAAVKATAQKGARGAVKGGVLAVGIAGSEKVGAKIKGKPRAR